MKMLATIVKTLITSFCLLPMADRKVLKSAAAVSRNVSRTSVTWMQWSWQSRKNILTSSPTNLDSSRIIELIASRCGQMPRRKTSRLHLIQIDSVKHGRSCIGDNSRLERFQVLAIVFQYGIVSVNDRIDDCIGQEICTRRSHRTFFAANPSPNRIQHVAVSVLESQHKTCTKE